jgi:hypothetical protein
VAQLVVRPEAAAGAIDSLLTKQVHPTFAGYLCIKREAVRQGRHDKLRPDFFEFHETFLRVPGGPKNKPYCRPFWDATLFSKDRVWYHKNVAGTYAPSSAERIPSFMEVVEIDRGRYSLRAKHWERARHSLLFDRLLPVVPLALFLYRDFAFDFPAAPGLWPLVSVFREEFGYPAGAGDTEFDHVYSTDGVNEKLTETFQAL